MREDIVSFSTNDLERNASVSERNEVALNKVGHDFINRDTDTRRRALRSVRSGCENNLRARLENGSFSKRRAANLWTGKVRQDPDVRHDLANPSYEFNAIGRAAVREGDSGNIHTGFGEPRESRFTARGWPDSRHNARPTPNGARTLGAGSYVSEEGNGKGVSTRLGR
jgi:hypothetical protein